MKESETKSEDIQIIEGELLEVSSGGRIEQSDEVITKVAVRKEGETSKTENQKPKTKLQIQYLALPLIFLTVTLLGGWRLTMPDSAFLFIAPPLICLIYAVILLILFFRAGLIKIEGWFSEDFTLLKNVANAGVLLTLFTATAQIFNSLIPEQGLPFWVFAFCFLWILTANLFSVFDTKRLLQSLGSVFGFAFVAKYLVLSYLTAPVKENSLLGIFENLPQEVFTYLLDLPRYSAGTGYIQFFAVLLYLVGLFLLSPVSVGKNDLTE